MLVVLGTLDAPILLAQQATEPAAESFLLDSTASTYPFVMRLEGTAKRGPDTIEVVVKTGSVHSAIPAEYGQEGKVSHVAIAFGVGRVVPAGWQMGNDTEPQVVTSELTVNETLPITRHRFIIRGLEGLKVGDMWLVARLTVDQKLPGIPPGALSSYACSEVNLLGETPRSKERSKRMLASYSKAC